MKCRHCSCDLKYRFLDLGYAPPSNAYLKAEDLHKASLHFPLRILLCETCWLVQTEDYAAPEELFSSAYAYFSSFSASWVAHAERFVRQSIKRFELTKSSFVVELAANDGYLLQFVKNAGIPCLGVEPTASTARVARSLGIEIEESFFGVDCAQKLLGRKGGADLIVANNVLAHVPDINDFVSGVSLLLKSDNSVAVFEFPHLCNLIGSGQFDTVYHEHYSYLSLFSVNQVFKSNGLEIFDVEEISTHGGSLRVYAQRALSGGFQVSGVVNNLLARELSLGINKISYYSGFQDCAERVKNDFISFLIEAKHSGKKVAAYGAAAKGNTLLNFAGLKTDLIKFVVDKNPAKQGLFLPGSCIPIVPEDHLIVEQPDFVVVFPWNLIDEVSSQLQYVRAWGGKLVTAVPQLKVFDE